MGCLEKIIKSIMSIKVNLKSRQALKIYVMERKRLNFTFKNVFQNNVNNLCQQIWKLEWNG